MRKRLTFQQPSNYPSNSRTVNWLFPFIMVDASLIDAPEEMSETTPHIVTVTATFELVSAWGFYHFEEQSERGNGERHNMMRVLFEHGARYVTQKLKEMGSLEREEKLILNTSVAKVPCPFDPTRIKGPDGHWIEVDIDEQVQPRYSITSAPIGTSTLSTEAKTRLSTPLSSNTSGGVNVEADRVTVGNDVVGRDKTIQADTYIGHALIIQSGAAAQAAKEVVNTQYLATMVGKEPFTEKLPRPLISTGFEPIQIGDIDAVHRLTAVQINLSIDPEVIRTLRPDMSLGGLKASAHIEIYKSKEETLKRYRASKASLISRFPEGTRIESAVNEAFCADCHVGLCDFWTCIGSSEFAYAEVMVIPSANANLGIATGTLSALLKYTDKLTALASH